MNQMVFLGFHLSSIFVKDNLIVMRPDSLIFVQMFALMV